MTEYKLIGTVTAKPVPHVCTRCGHTDQVKLEPRMEVWDVKKVPTKKEKKK